MNHTGNVQGDSMRERRSAFYRVGAFAVRRRWWVMATWLVVFVLMGPFLGKLTDRLSQGGFEVPGSQSDQVKRAIENDFKGQYEFTDTLVMHSDSLSAQDAQFHALFGRVRQALLTAPGVGAVDDPYSAPALFISQDGHTLTAQVGLSDNQDQ